MAVANIFGQREPLPESSPVCRHAKQGNSDGFWPSSHPGFTGLPERSVQLVKRQLIKWAISQGNSRQLSEWHLALPDAVNNINARYSQVLGITSAEAFLGFNPSSSYLSQKHQHSLQNFAFEELRTRVELSLTT
jgi:hypothetical protein